MQENAYLIDVCLPVPLNQYFTYRLPKQFDPESLQAGHRVLVPFRAKLIHGITVTSARPMTTGTSPTEFRELVDVDQDTRLVTEEVQRLIGWMTTYYQAPPGEALKLVFPPGLLDRETCVYSLTPKGKERSGGDDPTATLLRALEGQALTLGAWEAKTQTKIGYGQARQLENDHFIQLDTAGRKGDSLPMEEIVRLSEEETQDEAQTLKRSPKQLEMYRWLKGQPNGFASIKEVNKQFERGSGLVNQLVAKGFCLRDRIPKHDMRMHQVDFVPEEEKTLTEEQATALSALSQALKGGSFSPFLLFGVTGSGKTEVYLRAIQACLDQGRQALFLVPEIALTPLMKKRIQLRFGDRLAILHSMMSLGRRHDAWSQVLAGKIDVVLGPRSAVFAPLPNLGLIVVDEEHDNSYKQNDALRYHARDVAIMRAKMADCTVVLGSATPSLESWQNHRLGRHHILELTKRATDAPLPQVEIVDMREEFARRRKRVLLAESLEAKMEEVLNQGQQVMILLNRRGFHSFLLCRKCGEALMCSQCEVSLTFHKTEGRLKCHYCGEVRAIPKTCPSCEASAGMLQFFGEGTQQVQEYLTNRFPQWKVDRIDRDRISRRDMLETILAKFERGHVQILVGTQMIAKGHDFPNVTLVGILNADMGLRAPDFRCAELTFQLVTQVAGRSGRGDLPGRVVVQTYMPGHYSLTHAAQHDFPGFLKKELHYRNQLFYPPFAHMVNLLIRHKDPEKAEHAAHWMAVQMKPHLARSKVFMLGPTKAPVGKIKNINRYQIMLKAAARKPLHQLVSWVTKEAWRQKILGPTDLVLDIDPYQFM